MRLKFAMVTAALVTSTAAYAQSTSSGEPMKGYVEGFAQASFGNVTSQAFGAEGGVAVGHDLVIFGEGGRINDVATAQIGTAAQTIASFLTATQPGPVTYSVKEPVVFFDAGLKYMIPIESKVLPYVMGGFGIAKVTQDVKFTVAGTDVTNNMASVGVTLGSDLSGDFTKPLLVFGGGVMWPLWQQLMLDVQFRFGRIMAEDQGINVGRAGIGVAIKF